MKVYINIYMHARKHLYLLIENASNRMYDSYATLPHCGKFLYTSTQAHTHTHTTATTTTRPPSGSANSPSTPTRACSSTADTSRWRGCATTKTLLAWAQLSRIECRWVVIYEIVWVVQYDVMNDADGHGMGSTVRCDETNMVLMPMEGWIVHYDVMNYVRWWKSHG